MYALLTGSDSGEGLAVGQVADEYSDHLIPALHPSFFTAEDIFSSVASSFQTTLPF